MTSTPPSGTTAKASTPDERPPVAVIILGAGVMSFSALNMIRLSLRHDPQVHVPTPIVFVLAFVMLSGSLMAVLKVLGRAQRMDWLAAPLILGMAITFGWVGLYGDPRYCSSSGPIWVPMPSCHVAFTGASVLMLFVAWLAARSWWRSRRGVSAGPAD
jgi:uncharacterized membrane protein